MQRRWLKILRIILRNPVLPDLRTSTGIEARNVELLRGRWIRRIIRRIAAGVVLVDDQKIQIAVRFLDRVSVNVVGCILR